MGFPTPPRGSGRHHWDDRGEPAPYRDPGRYHPSEEDMPTDPTMALPPDDPVQRPSGQRWPAGRGRAAGPRPADVIVPRVHLEPDERIDRLRARSLRISIVRDVIWCLVGLYLLGQWVGVPVWQALGF